MNILDLLFKNKNIFVNTTTRDFWWLNWLGEMSSIYHKRVNQFSCSLQKLTNWEWTEKFSDQLWHLPLKLYSATMSSKFANACMNFGLETLLFLFRFHSSSKFIILTIVSVLADYMISWWLLLEVRLYFRNIFPTEIKFLRGL